MKMQVIPVTEERFREIWPVMKESFPRDERRSFEGQRSRFRRPGYVMLGLEEDGRFIGFIAGWDFGDFMYGEHLAVEASRRNEGLGDLLLKEFLARYPKVFFIEVEPPEDELTRRRIGFYERNGFALNDYEYIQPSLGKGREPVPLKIMTYPGKMTTEKLAEMEKRILRRIME